MALTSVIMYEGDNQTFVWKHPTTDFATGSQLIVHESQEAILFLNGRALDSFGPGRHELTTQNLPVLSKVLNLPTGGTAPFHAEIYFVNLVEQMGISWGTKSRVQFMEPTYGFPLSIGASGEMALAVREPRRLLVKLVGTEALLSQSKLVDYFKAFLQTRLKTALAQTIASEKLSIFELDAQLDSLSGLVHARLKPDFEQYGVELTQFLVTTVVRPEGDPVYEKFKTLYFRQFADVREAQIKQQVGIIDQETQSKRTVMAAEAAATKRKLEGYTYQQERGFDVAERMAGNEAVGQYANMGIGLGVMAGVGGAMSGVMGDAVAQATQTSQPAPAAPVEVTKQPQPQDKGAAGLPFCPECGYRFQGMEKFCPQCGTRRA